VILSDWMERHIRVPREVMHASEPSEMRPNDGPNADSVSYVLMHSLMETTRDPL
jgi:hypothetical protein